ncbi:hypothetical protein FRB90_004470 [Tulasnella sp. 427]|nr:hypothetical protein FRB90_004470 [Tulasnella sp. 427]
MPLLWNRLELDKVPLKWDMLEAKLERSGQAQLDIHIGQEPFVKSALPTIRRVLKMILPHLGRWGRLYLVDVPHKIKRIVLDQVIAGHAPLLEAIEVLQDGYLSRTRTLPLKNTCPRWKTRNLFSGHLPGLRFVEWSSPLPDREALPSFKNLRNLTLGEGTLTDLTALPFILLIHQLLADSPSLESLEIDHSASSISFMLTTAGECSQLQILPLTHHSLRILIVGSTPTLRSTVLRTLILPNLRRVSRRYYNHYVNLTVCEAIAQQTRFPSLRVLSIAEDGLILGSRANPNIRSQIPLLAHAISNLANLRVLTLRSMSFNGDKYLPDLGNCCPHLRWLLFVLCTGFTMPAIRGIVERRIQAEGIHPLETLCIQPDYWANAEDTCRPSQEDVEWFSQRLMFRQEDDLHYLRQDCWRCSRLHPTKCHAPRLLEDQWDGALQVSTGAKFVSVGEWYTMTSIAEG